jgi:hypothetical protein
MDKISRPDSRIQRQLSDPAIPIKLRLCSICRALAATLLWMALAQHGFAWGPDGHAMINRIAAENLPADVPAFLRSPAALDAIAYYSSEPDRWRSAAEPELNAAQAPEHFILLELAELAGPLPRRRYDYIGALAAAQAKHPELDLSPEKVGLQPYVTSEFYERLQSAFRDYRSLRAAKKDVRPSQCEIVFLAGLLGHYVGDGSMPLHTSIQYDGWVGADPDGYTKKPGIHWRFENDFVHANVKAADVARIVKGSKPMSFGDAFNDYVSYLRQSNSFVAQTYRLDLGGAFTGRGTIEGRQFAVQRLAAGACELRNMIYTAWLKSAEPVPKSPIN